MKKEDFENLTNLSKDELIQKYIELKNQFVESNLMTAELIEKLTDLNNLYQESQKAAKIGNWEFNLKNQKISWSDQIFALFNEPKEKGEPTFEKHIESVFINDREKWLAFVGKCMNNGDSFHFTYKIVTTKQKQTWVETYGHAEVDSEKKITRIFGTCQDVTTKVRHEKLQNILFDLKISANSNFLNLTQRLEQVLCRLLDFTDSTYGHITKVSYDTEKPKLEHFVELNAVFNEKFQLTEYLRFEKDTSFFNHLSLIERIIENQKVIVNNSNNQADFRIHFLDSKNYLLLPILVNGAVEYIISLSESHFNYDGDMINSLPPIFELTSEIILSDQFKNLEQELIKQKRISEHSSKLASIGVLAAGVGHEINNPLTIANGNVSMIRNILKKKGITEDEQLKHHFENYSNATKRIVNIVSGLRSFSRSNNLNTETFDLKDALTSTITLLKDLYQVEQISIEEYYEDGLFIMNGDYGRIQQVIMNLLSNAKDATEKKTDRKIKVSLQKDNNNSILTISDNGHGIPPEIQAKIFDAFFTTKPIGKGTGIGLSLVHSIVKEHLGEIILNSNNQGSNFRLVFPLVKNQTSNQDVFLEIKKAEDNSYKILVVDDDNEVRLVTESLFSELGHKITGLSSPSEAIEKIQQSHFDLIFTDFNMPEFNGVELAKKVKQLELTPTPKIFLISGSDNKSTKECQELFDGFLNKPFDFSDLEEFFNKLKK